MKRFQLCLLAVFMLLVSNCVAVSTNDALYEAQKKQQVGTGESLTDKKGSTPIGGATAVQKTKEYEKTANDISTKTLTPQDNTQSGTPGASLPGTKDTKTEKKTERLPSQSAPSKEGAPTDPKAKDEHSKSVPATEDGVSDPKTGGKPSQDAPVLEGAAKDQTKGESPQKNAPATENTNTDPKAKDDTSKSAPATKDGVPDPKTGGEPSEGAPVVSGTTAAPVAEGKPTEGNSGSASTSTHIPTDPAKGADSQASVKAGVLSLILSIGSVLAVFA